MATFDGRASTRKKEVEIEIDGEKLKFVVKGIGAYESDEITAKYCSGIDMISGKPKFDTSKVHEYNFEILRKILVEAPFELNDANVKDLDFEIATKLRDAVGVGPAALEGRKNLSKR